MKLFWVVLFLLIHTPAAAKPLIADVSSHGIAIDANFKGTSLLVFGAREEAGDILVVVRGPAKNFMLRRKERYMGMWVNSAQQRFVETPVFYALASTRALSEMKADRLLASLQLGGEQLTLADRKGTSDGDFRAAFLEERARNGLYSPMPQPIVFMGDTLFKTTIDFPDIISRGKYTAEVYLLRGNQLIAMQSTPIRVEKQGVDALVYDIAHRFPLLYGILAVLMALVVGWVATMIFRKL